MTTRSSPDQWPCRPARVLADDADPFIGGWHLEALALPVVEATIALAMTLWLVGWIPRHLRQQGPLAHAPGRASYVAYVIHLIARRQALTHGYGQPHGNPLVASRPGVRVEQAEQPK
jgi:hypothetical protein